MAHLATMMQGFHPFRKNDDGVPEDGRASTTSTLRGPDMPYPLGHIQSQGRTHGVMAQTVVPWIPLWAYDAWVARGVDWLVMSEDLPRPGQPRDGRAPTAASGCTTGRTTSAPHRRAGQGDEAHPAAARLLGGRGALAPEPEHDAPVRHARASAPTRARRSSTRTAARTTSPTCSSSTPRSFRRRRR